MPSRNQVKLTKRVVDAAASDEVDFTIWDTDVPGFGLCVRKSGRKVYLLKYRVGSGRAAPIRKPTIGSHGAMTVDQARKIARTWLAEARLGGDPAAARRAELNAPTMRNLFDRFLVGHAGVHKKENSAREDRRMIENHLLPALGSKRVKDVVRADIIDLHGAKAATLSSKPSSRSSIESVQSRRALGFAGGRLEPLSTCQEVPRGEAPTVSFGA